MNGDIINFAASLQTLDLKPRTVQFEIDGLMYTSSKLSASLGLSLLPSVTLLVGSSVIRMLLTGDSSKIDEYTIMAIAERAFKDGTLVPVAKALTSRLLVNQLGQTKGPGEIGNNFDDHFAGEYTHLLKVCIFSLAHQFRGPTIGAR